MSEAPDTTAAPNAEPTVESTFDPDSTVGTGSVVAIGCTILTLVILLIGIAIFISRQAN